MKNFNSIIGLCILALSFFSINQTNAQCIPAGIQPVFGTVTGSTGSFTFTSMPTGNVITITAPSAGIVYNIDLCATNLPGWPDGLNDSQITILDANAPTATALADGDDGCTGGSGPNGWGPTLMNFQSPAAGTYFIYLTEWAPGSCVADGLNTNYAMTVTLTTPGPCDASTLVPPTIQTVCNGDDFTLALSGTPVSDGGFAIGFDDTPGGTGGLAGGFTLTGFGAVDFPYTGDNDLNGVLSFNLLPPLAGNWAVKLYALDATGAACDSTGILSVNFLTDQTFFVDQSATGLNDGSSWIDAFTDLQSALAYTDPNACGIDVLVAEGTYYPGTTRGVFFTVDKDTRIFGGYAAGGAATATPDLTPTVLSGDVNTDGTLAGNSYHVVRATGAATVILVDLTISGGNADGDIDTQFGRSRGGGIYVNDALLGLFSCNVSDNYAGLGGGLFSTLSDITLIDSCNITGNGAVRGSALYHSNETNMLVYKSLITGNNATTRCAIEINNSLFTSIEQSVIANNTAANANAIALIATNRNQDFILTNTTVIGGPTNRSLFSMQVGFGDTLNVEVNNSIIAQLNTFAAPGKNIVVFNNNQLNFNANNSYFSGAAFTNLQGVGTNNIVETNTLFEDAAGDLLLNPDYSVQPCSPAVDAGDNTFAALLDDPNFDFAGNARTFNSTVDMGAFESQINCLIPREINNEEVNEVLAAEISIYPNPTDHVLNIQTDLEDITIQITDILGRTVITSNNERTIDVSELPMGTYILNIYQDGEWKGAEKLMKN